MVRATVLIPTHSHGPLLRLAAESALAQTVADLEVFIVLDGADGVTAAVERRSQRRWCASFPMKGTPREAATSPRASRGNSSATSPTTVVRPCRYPICSDADFVHS